MNQAAFADEQAVELLLHFARSTSEAGGYPSSELEPRILELAHAIGLHSVQVSATPTVINLTVGPIPNQQVYVLRVQPRPVDLYSIGRLDEIAATVADGRLDRRRALAEIDQLGRHPLRRPPWLVVGAHGLVGAALAPILRGGWRESLAAGIVGLAVSILTRIVIRGRRSAALVTPLGAFLASFLASALAHTGFEITVAIVTFSALIVFFPGMPMAIGVRELATAHLEAGLANSVNAFVQLVGIVFGVAVGRSLVTSWLGTIPLNAPSSFPHGVDIAAAALVGLAFVVTLRAPTRDVVWTCGAAVLAIVANLIATKALGKIAGVFVAGLLVGLAGNAIARHFRRSPLVFVVPGLLMLIPGTMGYWSAVNLTAGRTVKGIDTAFDTFVSLLAIAYGLLAATLILPDQPTKGTR
jgi:uncharacterized membrane protein YjjP (DUF1212 family)